MSSSEKPKNKLYVVSSILCPYKEEFHEDHLQTYICSDLDKAKKLMRSTAMQLYEDNEMQENHNSYFTIGENCIYFGEDHMEVRGHRCEWGMVKLEEVIVDQVEP